MVALFQAAKRFVERSLDADPRVFVRGILDSDVAEDRLDAPARGDAVRILTPAGALGTRVRHRRDRRRAGRRLAEHAAARRAAGHLAARGCRHPRRRRAPATLDRRRAAMHDELRLLARALSRATERVVVTAVDDDDTGPSVFFEFLPDPRAPHRRSPAVAARSRRAAPPRAHRPGGARARAARSARQLALLADAGVAGRRAAASGTASRAPTSTGPLRDLAREDVRVSPSRLHTLEECELNWVIGDLGGDPGRRHRGARHDHPRGARARRRTRTRRACGPQVESRWGELTFEAEWRDRAERTRARDLVRRLHLYLRRFEQTGGSLIGAEPHFEVAIPLDDAEAFEHGAILSGYIDRVELTPEGTVVIVDLKTGKREPQTDAKVVDNPQLGAYQLAFESGAIPAAAGHPAGRREAARAAADRDALGLRRRRGSRRSTTSGASCSSRASARPSTSCAGTSFTAPYEEHCRDEHSYGLCRIHTIGAVSAS